jgi:hypothetical protein
MGIAVASLTGSELFAPVVPAHHDKRRLWGRRRLALVSERTS